MRTFDYGIDLGTSNSSIAFAKDGRAELFGDEVSAVIPSAVMMNKDGSVLVGRWAYENAWRENQVATGFKRLLDTDEKIQFLGMEKPFTPSALSAEVLKELARLAGQRGHGVDRAVICTPAKFNTVQAAATHEAATLAGIDHVAFISEPMAASFGYGFSQEKKGKWIIFDFGAGTFDAVIVQNQAGRLSILEISGDNRLGGRDMDRIVWEELIIPRVCRETGLAPDAETFMRSRRAGLMLAERIKLQLTATASAMFDAGDLKKPIKVGGEDLELTFQISRGELESHMEPIARKAVDICRRLLGKYRDVSAVLLVGGPTKMPIVRELVKTLGIAVDLSVDPMTAVATGAALYAATVPVESAAASRPVAAAATPTGAAPSDGKVSLEVEYEPACEDTEAPVVIVGSDPRAAVFQVVNASGSFASGTLPLDGQPRPLMVPLEPRTSNVFRIRVFGSDHRELGCEPSEFSIYSGLTTSAPPTPDSFRVEIQDPDNDRRAKAEVLIAKGTPLPAKGSISLRTTAELSKASFDRIHVKIWEGEREHLRANHLAFILAIAGQDLRTKLPAKSEIQITLKVSAGRAVEAECYIPLLDQAFTLEPHNHRMDTSNPDQLEERRSSLIVDVDSLEETSGREHAIAVELNVFRQRLFSKEMENAFRVARTESSDSADAFARIDATLRDVDERLLCLREREEDRILPVEWLEDLNDTREVIESPLADDNDRRAFAHLEAEGNSALERKRFGKLRALKQDVVRLRFRILGRDIRFWKEFYRTFSKNPAAYIAPSRARTLLDEADRAVELDELRRPIVELLHLRPMSDARGSAILDSNLGR